MEQKLGRALRPDETVHHINGVRTDNRIENLELWVKRNQPAGQRVADRITDAVELLRAYAPHLLSGTADMVRRAKSAGIKVIEVPVAPQNPQM